MQNKKLIGLGLVIALILLVGPKLLGNMAKDNIEQQAVQISQIPGYNLKIQDYDQGWFSSHATIVYSFDAHTLDILKKSAEKAADQQLFSLLEKGLAFDVAVAHGPVTFQNGINFALLTMTMTLQDFEGEDYLSFKKNAGIDRLLDMFISVSYSGATEIIAHSPAFKLDQADTVKGSATIEFDGMDINAAINSSQDEYEVSFQIGKVIFENAEGKFHIGNINAQANGEKINEFLWLGKGTTALETLTFTQTNGIKATINNITNDYELHQESDTELSLNWTADISEIATAEVNIKDISLDLNLNHLNSEAVTDYVKSLKAAYQSPDGTDLTAEQITANTQAIAVRAGENILKGSPELKINNFQFKMDGGFFDGDALIAFNGEGLENIKALSDKTTLNKRLTSRMNFKFDKALALAISSISMKRMAAAGMDLSQMPREQLEQAINVQTSMILKTYVTQGYFTVDGEIYSTQFEMKDGKPLINGKVLPVPGL